MSLSPHIDDNKKFVLILGKGPAQGLEHTLTEEKIYSFNFTEDNKTFCLSLHYNGENSYLIAKGTETINFKFNFIKRFRNCSNSIMSRKYFKRPFSRSYEKDWIKWICL